MARCAEEFSLVKFFSSFPRVSNLNLRSRKYCNAPLTATSYILKDTDCAKTHFKHNLVQGTRLWRRNARKWTGCTPPLWNVVNAGAKQWLRPTQQGGAWVWKRVVPREYGCIHLSLKKLHKGPVSPGPTPFALFGLGTETASLNLE